MTYMGNTQIVFFLPQGSYSPRVSSSPASVCVPVPMCVCVIITSLSVQKVSRNNQIWTIGAKHILAYIPVVGVIHLDLVGHIDKIQFVYYDDVVMGMIAYQITSLTVV